MNATELTDLEFVLAFQACDLPNENFHHRDHVRLAWVYLKSYGELEARRRLSEAIRKFAAFHGKSDKYHETITAAWLRLVARATARGPSEATFDEVTIAAPELLDKRTIERFYSAAALASSEARS